MLRGLPDAGVAELAAIRRVLLEHPLGVVRHRLDEKADGVEAEAGDVGERAEARRLDDTGGEHVRQREVAAERDLEGRVRVAPPLAEVQQQLHFFLASSGLESLQQPSFTS